MSRRSKVAEHSIGAVTTIAASLSKRPTDAKEHINAWDLAMLINIPH